MNPVCPKCFSNQVVPITGASMRFPQSLEPTLLSPTVLASVGASLCKQCKVPAIYGVVVGTLAGLALSHLTRQTLCYSYYCKNCQQVFEKLPIDMDTSCHSPVVHSI